MASAVGTGPGHTAAGEPATEFLLERRRTELARQHVISQPPALLERHRSDLGHQAGYERQRRHATLVAIGLDLGAALTVQAIDLFDRPLAS